MSDFSDIVKPFLVTPVAEDTTVNIKPLSSLPARAVDLVSQSVVVPAVTLNISGTYQVPYIVLQYNYSVPVQFRITNFGELRSNVQKLSNCILCVRFRVGTTVYRYQLTGSSINTASVPSTIYSGQLILPNFVIELWQTSSASTFGIVTALSLMTSIIRVPTGQDDYLPDSINSSSTTVLSQLQAAINPETLPTTYDSAGSWLIN